MRPPASRFLRHRINPGIPVPRDEVEDPAHDRPSRQTATEDQATERHEAGHRIHSLVRSEILDGNGPAADSGDHGADQSDGPVACRARRRHQHHDDGREHGAAYCYAPGPLNAAAPATPLLVGSGVVNLQEQEPVRGRFDGRNKKTTRMRLG